MDNAEVSQPQVELETPSLDAPYINTVLLDSLHDDYATQEEDSNILSTHMCKKEFIDNGHVRSGKYFPVAIKSPSNNILEWLTTEKEDEKFLLNQAKTEEASMECVL